MTPVIIPAAVDVRGMLGGEMKVSAIVVLVVFTLTMPAILPVKAGWDPNKDEKVRNTVQAFKKKDPGLNKFFAEAYGYAVFPSVIKGGAFGFGGAYGKGQVFERGVVVGDASVSQGSIGFQLGGQSYSEIVFFKDREALQRFKSGNLKFAAQASAVAVTEGVAANAAYDNGVAVFSLPKKGLMVEAAIGGQRFVFKPSTRKNAAN
jgi:lipid-binding SYLF domain-containing protein